MRKFIITAEMRDLEKQVSLGEISYSRMIEILCEKADEYRNQPSKERITESLVRKLQAQVNNTEIKFREMVEILNNCNQPSKEIHKKDIRKILDRISVSASFVPEGVNIVGAKEGLNSWIPDCSKELAVEQILSLLSKQRC